MTTQNTEKNQIKMSDKKLSDVRLLQIAEMKSLCKWGEERLKDIHFKLTLLLDDGNDQEIEKYMKKIQPFFIVLKNIGTDSEYWIHDSTKRVLEYYTKKETSEVFNELDELFKESGSQLSKFIYVKEDEKI